MGDLQIPTNPAAMSIMPEPAAVAPRRAGACPLGDEAGEKAARDFESVLLHKMMEQMQRTIPDSGLLSSGITRQVQGIFWFYLAQDIADNGGMGLWRDIYRDVSGASAAAAAAKEAGGPAPAADG